MTARDAVTIDDGYILTRSAGEAARLGAQARILDPVTRRVLDRAGLAAGMRCLDAGCGAGEVMRLIGRRVGPTGHVTGLDIDAAQGARMLAALQAGEGPQFAFVEGDVTRDRPVAGAPFDVVFARLLLCHMTDPVGTLRRLAALVRPGGRLVLMDYDMSRLAVRPENPAVARSFEIVTDCFRLSGKDADAGLRLGEYLARAGLPAPEGYEIDAIFGSFVQVGDMLDGVLASLAPAAAALGIAGSREVESLRAKVRALTAAGGHTGLGPLVIGVWTTIPA